MVGTNNLRRRLTGFLLAALMLFSLMPPAMAEGEDAGEEPGAEKVTYTAALSNQSLSMKVGGTATLSITINKKNADGTSAAMDWDAFQEAKGTIAWEVKAGDENRIKVEPKENSFDATVTAVGVGETTQDKEAVVSVTVKMGEQPSLPVLSCKITVSPSDPAGVTISPATVEVAPGATWQLNAKVSPETAPQKVTWATADDSIAELSDTGDLTTTVIGRRAGKTDITASSTTKVASATVIVQGIVLKDSVITLFEGENYTLGYEIFGDQLGSNVEWTSSNTDVVAVSNGYLMPKSAKSPSNGTPLR